MTEIFTIGHSNHSIEKFISLLKKHEITAVADVRSHPFSRYLPHFNKAELDAELSKAGIKYLFLGRELGARPEDSGCYDLSGKALYERIAATPLFSEGIQRLIEDSQTEKITLLCAEKDPMTCHRTILVCEKLRPLNLQINHILSDGNLEAHQQLEERLLAKYNKSKKQTKAVQLSLFDAPPEPPAEIELEEAYRRQGREIAYIKKEKK
jgi:uncharacterized protein (DUF488 family)